MGRARAFLAIALALLALTSSIPSLLASPLPAIDRSRTLYIVAVSTLPNGTTVGVHALLRVEVRCPGHGHVYLETWPLTEIDTQASARVAAMVAAMVAGVPFSSCDYFASIVSNSSIVGGPSASLAMAVAFAAALMDLPLDERVVMTGMVMPDGSVGPVGGLYHKLLAAAEVGAKTFLVPFGQINVTTIKTVVQKKGPVIIVTQVPTIISLAKVGAKLGVKVIQVATVFEALHYATDGAYKPPSNPELVKKVVYSYSKLVKPVVKEWIDIERDELSRTMDLAKEAWKNASRELPSYVIESLANYLYGLWREINESSSLARELEAKGLLYAAASRYFYALVLAKRLFYLAKALVNPKSINASAKGIMEGAKSILSQLEKGMPKELEVARLSIYMDVAERAYEAMDFAKLASKVAITTIEDAERATSYLGYADARLLSAKLWMKLLNTSMLKTPVVDLIKVWRAAQSVLDYARIVRSYAYALASEVGVSQPIELSEASEYIKAAESASNPIFKLTLAISGLSYAYTALVKIFKLPSTVRELNKSVETLLALLAERNAVPPDTILYLQLARGSLALEFLSKICIRLASFLSIVVKGWSTSAATSVASEKTVTVTTISTVTKVVTVTKLATVSVFETTPVTTTIVKSVTVASERYSYQLSLLALIIACLALALASIAMRKRVASYASASS